MIRDQETLNILLKTVSKFVKERLVPLEKEVSETDNIPKELIQEMKTLGLFGLTIPEQYGGLGLTMEEEVLVTLELAQTSPSFMSLLGVNNGIGSQSLVVDGTEVQKQKYLPKLASGELLSAFALTEADAGSDAGGLKTTAVKEGDDYLLNGTKRFITNAPEANIFTVMARTDLGSKGASGISAFIVERAHSQFLVTKSDIKMGHSGAHTADVIFENCKVPMDNLIGHQEGMGFKTAMKILDHGRIHIASISVGVAERILNDALKYALERKQFGRSIAQFQLIQAMLADSKAEILAAKSMVLETARKHDRNEKIVTDASCCKLFATEMCGRVADRAVQILGGAGYMADYGIERFYRDVRLFRIFEGTSQIQQLVIARNMIKDFSA